MNVSVSAISCVLATHKRAVTRGLARRHRDPEVTQAPGVRSVRYRQAWNRGLDGQRSRSD
jgi:hypothetical protein